MESNLLFLRRLKTSNISGLLPRTVVGMLSLFLVCLSGVASAADGFITVKSNHDVGTTMSKLQAIVESKGMNVFDLVDHTAGAAKADIELRPTQVLIFGNPKVGTPLMKCSQSIAIDLPQKALVWEDENGDVWLGYNDPSYLKSRHATDGCDEVFAKVAGALANFSAAATAP